METFMRIVTICILTSAFFLTSCGGGGAGSATDANNGTVDDVHQLPDIPRIVVLRQHVQNLVVNFRNLFVILCGKFFQEGAGKEGNIAFAFFEGRQVNGIHIKAVE